MKALVFVLFLPLSAWAVGPGAYHFHAVFPGEIVYIEQSSDGEEWNGRSAIYSSETHGAFRYCWLSEDDTYFYCASTKETKSAVSFRRVEAPIEENKEASLLLERIEISETGGLQDYYLCEKGCSSKLPKYIFNIGDTGC